MRRTMLLSLIAILPGLFPETKAFGQTADDLFDPAVLHEIRINVHPSDWKQLKAHFDENTHYPADFHWIFQGKDVAVPQVSIRSRGLGSRSSVKPGLQVQFDRFTDHPFLGLRSIVLRNNTQDPSMLRERIAMTFMNLMGMPAPRQAHTRLYVNGEYAGLYSIVEAVDPAFLQRVFGQNNGYLYKHEWTFGWSFEYLGADPNAYSPDPFEPENHETDPDPSPLELMVRAINLTSDPYFQKEVSPYIDLNKFMTYIAVENFIAEQDGLIGDFGVANIYLYRFENSTLSQFIPWDKSNSFYSLDWPIFRHIDAFVLSRRAFAIPELRQAYLNALSTSAELAGDTGGWLEQEITQEYLQIREAALEDP